ncbi:Enoyl-CoA delta isomerase 3 [Psilocybe cubensis]|uniref:ClpP/crotonase n=2 Tax=Psilocybe cubensis TaxID=181762 RepID=A0A8H7Y8K9_PSICU|nr:Enoyl-CoA delta isomerase 3 [Psilocybe cubensis]KAH9485696.1 Enoyl-CoA delta isomerase 3 [Psilocybe cubensis]
MPSDPITVLPASDSMVTLTHPTTTLWILELHNGVDNRLSHTLINKGIKPALDVVEREWREQRQAGREDAGHGALIVVGRRDQDKFFSNGLNYEESLADPNFFQQTFNPMLTRLLTFPIPTIAAINGHCFAGGFVLAQACDYRVMTDGSTRNAWLCMNEIHFGAPYPLSVASLLTSKYGNTNLHRKIALEGHRFTPPEALKDGVIDYIVKGTTKDILKAAEEVANRVSVNAKAGCWGLIKRNIYKKLLDDVIQDIRLINPLIDAAAAKARL